MMKTKLKNALAYIRTAKSEEGLHSESMIRQKQAINAYADENGYTIVQYIEHGNRSGRNNDFAWLDEILSENQTIKYILLYTGDRLTRNFADHITLEKHLADKYGVIIDTAVKYELPWFLNPRRRPTRPKTQSAH